MIRLWLGQKDIEKYKNRYEVGYEVIRQERYQKQKQLGIIAENTALSKPEHQPWEALSDSKKRMKSEPWPCMLQ